MFTIRNPASVTGPAIGVSYDAFVDDVQVSALPALLRRAACAWRRLTGTGAGTRARLGSTRQAWPVCSCRACETGRASSLAAFRKLSRGGSPGDHVVVRWWMGPWSLCDILITGS